jgi:hypothetical protein
VIFSNKRHPRTAQGPPLAGYPARLRRLVFWYDDLNDWQRVQYAVAASLFLLACGGYLLGLGSTMVLQRVELEDSALAAQPLNTETVPTATVEPLAVAVLATATPTDAPRQPSPTAIPPMAEPSRTPFSGPVIAEPPAVPRYLPANVPPPVVAPVAPRGTPTPDKPRNLETSKPEPPAASIATSTPGSARTALPAPTAVRQLTPARPTTPTVVRPSSGFTTPLPTLALPGTPATQATAVTFATSAPPAPTRLATSLPAVATSAAAPGATPARTPPPR